MVKFKYALCFYNLIKEKMKLNIVIGGKAGQGINFVSKLVSETLMSYGYYVFNYRDYPSIIRGGHNYNVLSISDGPIESNESTIDGIVAMDELTKEVHKQELKKGGFVIDYKEFEKFGINLNVALSGALVKILGINKKFLIDVITKNFGKKPTFKKSLEAAEAGYVSQKEKYSLKKLSNKITLMAGSKAIALGAINSGIDLYIAYPMTPATNALHELAAKQLEYNYMVFQAENEISVANMALGAGFAGAKTMIGSSGGGFDLMAESLSMQGISEIPLTVYLASRVGPGTGIPTYSMQGDLDIALRTGHGEFPRVVVSPGNPTETVELTNQAMYFSQKFNCLSIILSDKHVAESEFSTSEKVKTPLKVNYIRKVPGETIIKASSYECDNHGITTESPVWAVKNANLRLKKYEDIKKECNKMEMIKIHGNPNSKNLIIGWGSTRGAILDAIRGENFKFLQVLYLKPLSNKIKEEMLKAKNVILVESNLTGQLGKLIREKTGIKIEKRILKYDGRPFLSDELKQQLLDLIKKGKNKK